MTAALNADSPPINPIHYGCSLDESSGTLVPVGLPQDVSPTPVDVF